MHTIQNICINLPTNNNPQQKRVQMKKLALLILLFTSATAMAANRKAECRGQLQDHIKRLERVERYYSQGDIGTSEFETLIRLNDMTVSKLISECRSHAINAELITLSWDHNDQFMLEDDEFAQELYKEYAAARDLLLHGTERVD